VIVSMRSTAAAGMLFTLTAIDALTGIARRPSSNTRLRFEPRPRRLTTLAPGVRRAPDM
jgi:hypothetical protein